MRPRTPYLTTIERLAFAHGKMAFVAGPRQVGKTTLAYQLRERGGTGGEYFTWDDPALRRRWLRDPVALIPDRVEPAVVIFDELHRAPRWKTTLKAIYDQRRAAAHIVVTGSARLDLYRRGGDSLAGRYFLFRLHPFSLGELCAERVSLPDPVPEAGAEPLPAATAVFDAMWAHGTFPEPFLARAPQFTTAWAHQRGERLLREDLRDLTRASEVGLIEALAAMLAERVGSLLSVEGLARDLEVSHPTAKRWLEWLARLYLVYLVRPHARGVARGLRKQPKVYLWEWSAVHAPGPRFENLVAGHLCKAVDFWNDAGFGRFTLSFIRDKEKREVDFLVTRGGRPFLLVEAKHGDSAPSAALVHFARQLRPARAIQLVAAPGVQEWFAVSHGERGLMVSADRFLPLLP